MEAAGVQCSVEPHWPQGQSQTRRTPVGVDAIADVFTRVGRLHWQTNSSCHLEALTVSFEDLTLDFHSLGLHAPGCFICARLIANDGAITIASGYVFTELGFSLAESSNLRFRSQMMTALRKFMEKEGLTQANAAKRLKVSQPRISDLTSGKTSRFSLDTLVNILADASL